LIVQAYQAAQQLNLPYYQLPVKDHHYPKKANQRRSATLDTPCRIGQGRTRSYRATSRCRLPVVRGRGGPPAGAGKLAPAMPPAEFCRLLTRVGLVILRIWQISPWAIPWLL